MKALERYLLIWLLAVSAVASAGEPERRIEAAERAAEDGLYEFAEREAAALLNDASFPHLDRAMSLLVRTAAGRGDQRLAEQRFKQFIGQFPKSRYLTPARLYYAQALVAAAEGAAGRAEATETLRLARQQLHLVLRDFTHGALHGQASFYLGLAACINAEHEQAAAHFTSALRGDLHAAQRALLAFKLAQSYRALGQLPQALAAVRGALEQNAPAPIRRNAYRLAGELHYLERRWHEARQAYLEAAAGSTDDLAQQARYEAAWALWKAAEDASGEKRDRLLDEALAEFMTLSQSTVEQVRKRAQVKTAHLLILKDRPEEAGRLLRPLERDDAYGVQAGYYLAVAALQQGDDAAAERFLKDALGAARDAGTSSALRLELVRLYERQQRYDEAIAGYRLLAREAEDEAMQARYSFEVARLLVLAGEEDEALSRLAGIAADERVGRCIPAEAIAYWQARLALQKALRATEAANLLAAETLLADFIRLNPASTHAEEARALLLDLYAVSPLADQQAAGVALIDHLLPEAPADRKVSLLLRRARLEAAQNMHSKSAGSYREAARSAPADERTDLLLRAAAEYAAAGETAAALAILDDFAEPPAQPELRARFLRLKADLFRTGGRHAEAAGLYASLATASFIPHSEATQARLLEAEERLHAGQAARAIELLEALDAADPAARYSRHSLLAEALLQAGRAAGSLPHAQAALEAAGADAALKAHALTLSAQAHAALTDSRQAYALYQAAATLATAQSKPPLLLAAADTAFAAAMYQEARSAYIEALYSLPQGAPVQSRERALRGAVEAGMALTLETSDRQRRRQLREETGRLIEQSPDAAWKAAALTRLGRLAGAQ